MPSIMVASSSIHIKVIQDIVRPKCIHYKCYSTTYHGRASECLQNNRGTDLVVFVLILFPQMSNNLQLYLFLWLNHRVLIKLCVLTIRTYVVL